MGDDVGIVLGVITTKPRIEDVNRNLGMRVKKEEKSELKEISGIFMRNAFPSQPPTNTKSRDAKRTK